MTRHDADLLRRAELIGEISEIGSAIAGLAEMLEALEDQPAPHTLAALLRGLDFWVVDLLRRQETQGPAPLPG